MKPVAIEIAALVAVLAAVGARAIRLDSGVLAWSPVVAASAVLVIVLLLNPARWQLLPLLVVVLIVVVATARGYPIGIVAGLASLALIIVSLLLVLGFPGGRAPAPDGPFAVGTATVELARPAAEEEEGVRRLSVKAWYPANAPSGRVEPESVWVELRHLPDVPRIARLLLAYLGRVDTHSFPGAAAHTEGGRWPLLV
jgi:hypothetical protein